MMHQKRAMLKPQAQFQGMIDSVLSAIDESRRTDHIELTPRPSCSISESTCLMLFVAQYHDGDLGPTADTADRRVVLRLPDAHARPYIPILGGLSIPRVASGTRVG